MKHSASLQAAIDLLLEARAHCRPAALPGPTLGLDSAAQGYAVQDALLDGLRRAGQEGVGFKLGLTDINAQARLRTDGPLIGRLLQGRQYWSGDRISISDFVSPRVEPEIAFIIQHRLDDPDLSEPALLAGIGGLVAALEICDSVIPGWPRSPWDALADNLCSGAFVLASQPVSVDLNLADAEARLYLNGELRSTGSGRQCMGSPVIACLWLARHLASRGTPLQAGDIVLSGALGPMQDIAAGDEVRASIEGVGELSCRFE